MKKTVIGRALLLSGIALTARAHAQSSITLYGLLDMGVDYTNRATTGGKTGPLVSVTGSVMQSNRWGFLGKEDLGGGLTAVFQLEAGFSIENGTMSKGEMWGKQSWVGLAGNFGQLTFGSHNDFMYDISSYSSIANVSGGMAGSASLYGVDNRLDGTKIDNSARYLKSFGNAKFGAMYGFGNTPGGIGKNNAYSLLASYSSKYVAVAVATTSDKDSFGTNLSPSLYPYIKTSAGLQNVGAGVLVTPTDKLRLFGDYTYSKVIDSPRQVSLYSAGASYEFTPFFKLGAGYTRAYVHDGDADRSILQQEDFVIDYRLSKRTDVYNAYSYQHLSGGTMNAWLFPATPSGVVGSSQFVVRVGMRTLF